MPLAGTQIQPRDIAALADAAFTRNGTPTTPIALCESVCICLAESQGFDQAYHDNIDDNGKVTSRDVGLWQINIPASQIGTAVEDALYDPAKNADRMVDLYESRGWQPWASYNSTIYLFDSYLGRATRGLGNYFADQLIRRPAVKLDGTPYVHGFKSPVLDYWFRVIAGVQGIQEAEAALGWSAKTRSQVTVIHQDLAATITAMKASLPAKPTAPAVAADAEGIVVEQAASSPPPTDVEPAEPAPAEEAPTPEAPPPSKKDRKAWRQRGR